MEWISVILLIIVVGGAVGAVGMANNIKRKRGADDIDKDVYR